MHSQKRFPLRLVLATTCGQLLFAPGIHAQQAAPGAASPDSLDEVVVTGVRKSLEASLNIKQEAVNVIDTIGAEDIGKFPDLNLSESLQRIPGVTLDRNNLGEGSQINVRGLGPDFTRVEIDGMSGAASTPTGAFSFQSIASELFQRATVVKTPTASMVEGGLAGTVTLETPHPLDFEGARFALNAEGSRGSLERKDDPRVYALASQNWGGVFGILGAFTYSKLDANTNEDSFGSWGPLSAVVTPAGLSSLPPDVQNAASPRTTAYYHYEENLKNLGGNISAQYRPSDALTVTLDGLYAQRYGMETDNRPDAPVEGSPLANAPTNYTVQNGALTSATISGIQARIGTSVLPESDTLAQVTLHADWKPADNWLIKPYLGYSTRRGEQDLDLYSFASNNTSLTYNIAGNYPQWSNSATNYYSNPQVFGFNVFYFNKAINTDKEFNAKLDFERIFNEQGLKSIQFGARYSRETADNFGEYALLSASPNGDVLGVPAPALSAVSYLQPFYVGGSPAGTPGQILAVNPAAAAALYYHNLNPYTAPGFYYDPDNTALQTYEIRQNTLAAYAQLNLEFGPVRMDAGMRVVETDVSTTGSQGEDGGVISPLQVGNHYVNFLPSFNVRYTVRDDLIVRGAYSKVVNRPELDNLSPALTIQSGPKTASGGNPTLQPYTADQVDLGAEWYYHQGALLGATVFTKRIDDLITQTTSQVYMTFPNQLTGQPEQGYIGVTEPTNGNKATVEGLELSFQTPFYFLPSVFDKFGTLINATLASSSASYTSQAGAESTALPGLSKRSYNAVLYYDDQRFDTRVSWAWRSAYLPTTAGEFGASVYNAAYGQLDVAANYKILSNLQLNFQVLNVLQNQQVQYTTIPGVQAYMPTNVLQYERRWLFGARYSFR
jgi:iron complex outermembrane receptor protein